jgi:hypothetical protein
MNKRDTQLPMHAKRHSRFAKSDDDVSFPRDVGEKRPKKVGGCRPSRYAKRAPVDQHPPGSRPQPSHANGIGWNPPQQLA